MMPGRLQISHVAHVQEVEATVGDHQAFAAGAHGRPPFRQVFPGNDFLTEAHRRILVTAFPPWQERRHLGMQFSFPRRRTAAGRRPETSSMPGNAP